MSSDRFIYNKGDIQIGKSQRDFANTIAKRNLERQNKVVLSFRMENQKM